MRWLMLACLLMGNIALHGKAVQPGPIVCQGSYPGHLQGIDTDGSAIYWAFSGAVVKTDLGGKVLVSKQVPMHHGDLCVHDGKVYVAVNLGVFNQEEGAISEVWVYQAENLALHKKFKIPSVVHGSGGMTWYDGAFYVVGGLPKTHAQNYVYEYTPDFRLVKRHLLKSGYTLMGIQTINFINGRFWFGTYGSKVTAPSFSADPTLKKLTYYPEWISVGLMKLNGTVYRGDTHMEKDELWTGKAVPASQELQK